MTATALRVVPLDAGAGLRLLGEVDVSNLGAFRDALASIRPSGEVHLELGELAFIDLAGATVLVKEALVRGPQARMVLHQPPYALRRIMDVVWGPVSAIEVTS